MRLGKVIGRVTLSAVVPELKGGRWMIISPFNRAFFQQGTVPPEGMSTESTLVVYDSMGAGVGQTVSFVEGREAAQPFPKPPPIDAVTAALVDQVNYTPYQF